MPPDGIAFIPEQGDSEPCFGVLQALTCDLFESQPFRERKTVVPRIENSPRKGRFVLDWREWTICAENADEGGTARKLAVVQWAGFVLRDRDDEADVVRALLFRAIFGFLVETTVVDAVWAHTPDLNSFDIGFFPEKNKWRH